MSGFNEALLKQQREIKKQFKQLAAIFPGCFDINGKPLLATLTFPTVGEHYLRKKVNSNK